MLRIPIHPVQLSHLPTKNCHYSHGCGSEFIPFSLVTRLRIPNDFSADQDPYVRINVDPDPSFHFNADPDSDPAPLQRDGNLRQLVLRSFMAPLWASLPPFVSVHGPLRLYFEPLKLLKFYYNADSGSGSSFSFSCILIQLFILMQNRIQLLKIMHTHADLDSQPWL